MCYLLTIKSDETRKRQTNRQTDDKLFLFIFMAIMANRQQLCLLLWMTPRFVLNKLDELDVIEKVIFLKNCGSFQSMRIFSNRSI